MRKTIFGRKSVLLGAALSTGAVKIRHALTGAATAALVLVGASTATAQTVQPNTGSLACSSSDYFHQYTSYHGTICYTNTGGDNLSGSDFWTSEVTTGSNTGWFGFYDQAGNYYIQDFTPGQTYTFSPTIAFDYLDISSN